MPYHHLATLFLGISAFIASFGRTAQTANPEYRIKFENPPIGSHIRRDAVHGSPIPINWSYHELSPEHRAIVHRWYEYIAPGDEPPFPSDGLKSVHDAIRKGQAKLLVTGDLFLVATVEATGEVSGVKAFGSPSPEMTKFAGAVFLLTKFKPAVCGGRPCKIGFPLWYSFRVE